MSPSDFPGYTSGRCWKCNVRFIWKGKPRLKDAYCRWCESKLKATTHQFKGETVEQKPITKKEKDGS